MPSAPNPLRISGIVVGTQYNWCNGRLLWRILIRGVVMHVVLWSIGKENESCMHLIHLGNSVVRCPFDHNLVVSKVHVLAPAARTGYAADMFSGVWIPTQTTIGLSTFLIYTRNMFLSLEQYYLGCRTTCLCLPPTSPCTLHKCFLQPIIAVWSKRRMCMNLPTFYTIYVHVFTPYSHP